MKTNQENSNAVPLSAAGNGHSSWSPTTAQPINLASDAPQRRTAIKGGNIESPPQNVEFIATLAVAGDPAGASKTTAHARRTLGELYGSELTELKTISRQGHDNLSGIAKQILELTKLLNSTRRYHETERKSEPWTWFDKIQVLMLALVSLVLMGVGINSMATVLLESGIRAFENPVSRYLFSMIPVALPFAFKSLSRQFTTERGRAAYHTTIWLAGIGFAIVWAFQFASTFQGITQSAAQLAGALTLNESASQSNSKWMILVVSIVAESLLSAGCWLTIESIVERHQSAVRIANPAYVHTQAELNHWRALQAEEQEYLGKVDGRIQAIEDATEKYVAEAEAIYTGKKYATGARDEVNRLVDASADNGKPGSRRLKTAPMAIAVWLILSATNLFAAQTFVFGLASEYERADKQLVYQRVVQFALEGAHPGDRIAIYDAQALQPIATLNIPDGPVFQNNPRARVQRLQQEIAVLKQFFMTSSNAVPPSRVGTLNVPEFLGLVSTHLRRSGERTTIILIGLPFYIDPEGNCTMTDAFPSDGHLATDQRESVFGIKNKRQALAGATIHYAYLRECFVNDYHKERIGRFWTLFAVGQEGVLASFASNIELVLARAREDMRQAFMAAQRDPNDTKIEMRHVTPRTVPIWFPPTNVITALLEGNQPVPAPNAAVQPASSSVVPATPSPARDPVVPTKTAVETNRTPSVQPTAASLPLPIPLPTSDNRVSIGIMWSVAGCDFDLHVAPRPNAPELSYRNRVSADGKYFHDYRDRNDGLDYELVDLKEGLDTKAVRIWINFYKGRSPKAKGVAILRYHGKTYTMPFQFQATSGNSGFDRSNRSQSPYWVEIKGLIPQQP